MYGWVPLDTGIVYECHWTQGKCMAGCIGHSDCVWLDTRDTWHILSMHAKCDACLLYISLFIVLQGDAPQ